MTHSHGHHHHHPVPASAGQSTQNQAGRLFLALILTAVFVVGEGISGWYANSLALLSDAAHNLSDVLALALSCYALKLQQRPAHASKTFGYHRAGILAALINAASLAAIALWLMYEAYQRLLLPPVVSGEWLTSVGLIALVLNTSTAWLLSHGAENDLNLRSAFMHLMGDVLASLGAVLAGVGILYTGALWLDPLVSVLMSVLILWNSRGLLGEVIEILLESTPRDIDIANVVRDILQIGPVLGLHHVHVWSISREVRAFSGHIVVGDGLLSETIELRIQIETCLLHRYGIRDVTLQFEAITCEPDKLYGCRHD